METRPGCKVHAIIVASCHGNDDEAWSTQPKIIGLDSIPTAVRYRIEDKEELESST